MDAVTVVMVVFAGVVGPDNGHINRQLGALLHHDAKVDTVDVSTSDRKQLGTHGKRAERVVRKLHAGGVVAGEIVEGKRTRRLRVYVYDADGHVASQVEVPLEGGALSRHAIAMLREAVIADVKTMEGLDEEAPAAEEEAPAQANDSDEDKPAAPPAEEAAPAESESASADEPTPTAPAGEELSLHMGATVGIGFISRAFLPGVASVAPYNAQAVGTVRFQGDIEPSRRVRLDFLGERSMGMTTTLGMEVAETSITRWQAELSWSALAGRFSLAPGVGVGRRNFAIESKAPDRSPDGDYLYLIAGLRAALSVGTRVQVAAVARFEPVVSGEQPTMPAFGQAVRLGYDVDLALDVALAPWLLARAEAGYQGFSWSFADGGRAVDRYFGGALSLGARF